MESLSKEIVSKRLEKMIAKDKCEMGAILCKILKKEIVEKLNEYTFCNEGKCCVKFVLLSNGKQKIVVECEVDDFIFEI